MTRVSNFRNQSLPQLTLAIRGGHCGRPFTRLFGRADQNHVPAQVLGWRSIWAIVPILFGHSALVPFSIAFNVTRLSSTFTVVNRVVDVMAHLR